jgi:hypothetical protein
VENIDEYIGWAAFFALNVLSLFSGLSWLINL